MDCRAFRKHHLAYLDDTLPADTMAAAQRHILTCDRCAAHDTMVRRSLLVVHNLDELRPSADFAERLAARLATCERVPVGQPLPAGWDEPFAVTQRRRRPAILAVAAGAVVVGTLAWPGWSASGGTGTSGRATPTAERLATERSVRAAATGRGARDDDAFTGTATLASLEEATGPHADVHAGDFPITEELLQALATGHPMWTMAVLAEDAPLHVAATVGADDSQR